MWSCAGRAGLTRALTIAHPPVAAPRALADNVRLPLARERASSNGAQQVRVAIFDNLANNAYNQAKVIRSLGEAVDVVLDPLDRYVMSDPRWEDLDTELPPDELAGARLPSCELPEWVVAEPGALDEGQGERTGGGGAVAAGRRLRRLAHVARRPALYGAIARAAHLAGWRGARMALQRAWVIETLSRYDCVVAFGMGPAWATLAGVPFMAETWGGDITMLPFYDSDQWEGYGEIELPGPRRELAAQARLQRAGYRGAGRILLTDPRFFPYAERLGHAAKSVHLGFCIDTEKYSPEPEPELRRRFFPEGEGVLVFVPSRQDWYWKGSDRLPAGLRRRHARAAGGGAGLRRMGRRPGALAAADPGAGHRRAGAHAAVRDVQGATAALLPRGRHRG